MIHNQELLFIIKKCDMFLTIKKDEWSIIKKHICIVNMQWHMGKPGQDGS